MNEGSVDPLDDVPAMGNIAKVTSMRSMHE